MYTWTETTHYEVKWRARVDLLIILLIIGGRNAMASLGHQFVNFFVGAMKFAHVLDANF